jgi:hypothetical protein
MSAHTDQERAWARQWARAGPALAEVRARELQALTDDEALAITEQLLALVDSKDIPAARLASSGLVELQRVLHGRRV